MTYEEWINEHKIKHQKLVSKLSYLSDMELVKYFDFDNMVKYEPDFCLLYKENTKCHDMETLNCYLCACPLFRLGKTKSFCDIASVNGGEFVGPDGFIHQDCSGCTIPHKIPYIEANFDKDWGSIMKNVVQK